MKKVIISCATLVLCAVASLAQAQTTKTKVKQKPAAGATATKVVTKTDAAMATPAATPSTATTKQNEYVGTYLMQNMPFEEMVVAVKDGKLMSTAGTRINELVPTAEADAFKAGPQAIIRFQRDANQKVTGMEVDAAGMTFIGTLK